MMARLVFLALFSMGCVRGTCLTENMTWLSSDIMDVVQPVASPYLCQDLCGGTEECQAFTWTTEANMGIKSACFLFATTSNQTSCSDCLSGPRTCTCSSEVACQAEEENIVEIRPGVATEGQCQNICLETSSCMFYTWHDATSFPSYTCILLSSCDDSSVCSGCYSGPPECSSQLQPTTPAPAEEAILLSGGGSTIGAEKSVEVFSPSTGKSCSLPSLPDQRSAHTMNSLLICGGDHSKITRTTCLTFSSGKWITSHSLVIGRYDHTSWQREEGVVVLMGGDDRGGYGSSTTSELVQMGGEQGELSFPMQHKTERACSMPDLTSPTVIITGGWDTTKLYTTKRVSRYGTLGFIEDLPSSVVGRYGHGCGSYLREADGTQVFLVAGGYGQNNFITSTEVLTTASPAWILTTPLPRGLSGVRFVTIGGKLYATGGKDGDYQTRDEVLAWLDEEQQWVEEGKMKVARYHHAVTTIMLDDDAMAHCG